MLQNYLRIAFRNLWKHKLFTVINIVGLAAGLVVCLIVLTHGKGAFEYDNFHPKGDRINRILTDVTYENKQREASARSPMALAELLKPNASVVASVVRVRRLYGEFSGNDKVFDNLLSYAVDPTFFSLFGYKLKSGQPATQPNTVVLSAEAATRFFGTANPLGQTLRAPDYGALTVVGVLEEPTVKSHLTFDLLLTRPVAAGPNTELGYTYVLLQPGATADQLSQTLAGMPDRAFSYGQRDPIDGSDRELASRRYRFRAQALTDISPAREELSYSTMEPPYTQLAGELLVGLVTLLLAGFNYVNLTLARSLARAREVGIRKVVGALRWQIMGQFMAESVILSMLALLLAGGMLEVLRPLPAISRWFLEGTRQDAALWALFVGFTLLTGLLAGLVPARVLSGFQAAAVLRTHTGLKVLRGISLRKSLIVAQFAITLVAVVFLLTMVRQQRYMVEADYGFRREGVLNLPLHSVPYQRLAQEISRVAGVEGVSPISVMLANYGGEATAGVRKSRSAADSTQAFLMSVDAQFIPTMQLKLLAGRNLPTSVADSASRLVVINEEAVRRFGLRDARAAVGQTIWVGGADMQVAGVVQDFRYTTLVCNLKPLILRYQPAQFRYLNVAVAAGAEAAVKAQVQTIWQRLHPHEPFAGQWYADYLQERHGHVDDIQMIVLLVGLALTIACLGLLGMVTYQTETRTREVSIRKVLGATVAQVIALLSWQFVKLLLIAAAIGLPLGYLAGQAFLAVFAYHVSIGLETLAACLGLLLALGTLTIGIRTYRTALANPADCLRAE